MVVPGIGALFAQHTPTALGIIAGMAMAGDRQRLPEVRKR
jgi:hypothetical protein